MIPTLLFAVGLIALIKGADWLVAGASSLAGRLGVSALVIGLTIVSFGTSAPELVVNLVASLDGNVDIAIGNVLGSNIVNILLILGVSAVIYPLSVQHSTVWKEIPFALLAAIMLAVMVNDVMLDGAPSSILTRSDGIILIGFFVVFLYYIFGLTKQSANQPDAEDEVKTYSFRHSTLMVLGGIAGLVIGGKWVVDGAIIFAESMGVSQALIGLTIVAIGTSLPELATSAMAAYRKNVDIAVGNIVGSNIFNIFWILGVSAIISPLPFKEALNFDVAVTVIATLLLFLALFVGKRHTLERGQGVLFILVYVAYITFLVVRG